MRSDDTGHGPNVSRETEARLRRYCALLAKWNPAINLVAPSTLDECWQRHIMDSLGLLELAPDANRWVDLGSGGGLPGMVIAIVAAERRPAMSVTCIEADVRKCAFLQTVKREFGLQTGILSRRIEETPPQNADVVSARALAPLPKLLGLAHRHLAPNGVALFHKGENVTSEIDAARGAWRFDLTEHVNPGNPRSTILEIRNLRSA